MPTSPFFRTVLSIQRDRPIIKDLLTSIDKYCGRNLQKRDERIEAERRRQHEAQHAQLGTSSSNEQNALTAGAQTNQEEEEEEEKEVDPSIVGSLDDVYKDEPGSYMKGEDPFKKVPMMDDHEKPSSMMAMEKSVDAMVALVEHTPGSPLPEDATSLDRQLRQAVGGQSNIMLPPEQAPGGEQEEVVPPSTSIPLGLAVGAKRLLQEEAGDDTTPLPSQPVDRLGLTVMSS